MKTSARALALAAGLLLSQAGQAQNAPPPNPAPDARFPVLGKLPSAQQRAMAGLLDWQRAFDNLPVAELQRRLGPPDLSNEMEANAVTGKPMRSLGYRLSRHSELRFTIHEGRVAAVTMLLMPSANEAGPLD
ncbi:MAG: hypothetical protein EOO25_19120 [Comamonadaceae bacterium]|nr:MAG: hypothetical protein EOO25_19120 [Comamonadaceae bacterium]